MVFENGVKIYKPRLIMARVRYINKGYKNKCLWALPFLLKIDIFSCVDGPREPGSPDFEIGMLKLINVISQFFRKFFTTGCEF